MAGSVNKVILVGNLGRDPEVRFMPDGLKVVNFSVATSESWKDKTTGERKDKTEWHRVVVMNDRISDIAEKYLRKGSKVYVEGQLQTRKWTDQNGQERYSTEVLISRFKGELTLLDSKGSAGGTEDYEGTSLSSGSLGGTSELQAPAERYNDLDDDVPF